ncbi:MAG TPA: hypothetical protein VHC63_09405 [Acidimicrobiales bacterium]|nr:hypothetical protein [Acidimicrobiales bacterium]
MWRRVQIVPQVAALIAAVVAGLALPAVAAARAEAKLPGYCAGVDEPPAGSIEVCTP